MWLNTWKYILLYQYFLGINSFKQWHHKMGKWQQLWKRIIARFDTLLACQEWKRVLIFCLLLVHCVLLRLRGVFGWPNSLSHNLKEFPSAGVLLGKQQNQISWGDLIYVNYCLPYILSPILLLQEDLDIKYVRILWQML